MTQMDRIKKVFNDLRADNLHILDDFYAPDTHFEDPIGTHKGLDAVKEYYGRLYKNVTSIEFVPLETISDGNKHVFVWRMKLKAKGLKGGEMVTLEGNSVIRFNNEGRVEYHRDYFDMGEFIYQHIPVLGWMVRKVNQRLRSE